MKNKKGFTLVEIIICIVLILLIGGSFFAITLNNKKQKEEKIFEVTRKLQEAAGVYLAINKEIDDTIEQNIYNGGSGYVIPIKTLLDEGFISEKYITTLESNGQKISDDAYMLAALFSGDTTMCDNTHGVITIQPNYDPEHNTEPYYLCNFTTEKKYVYYDLDGGKFNDGTEQVQLYNKNTKVPIESGGKVTKASDGRYEYSFVGWYDDEECTTPTSIDSDNKFELTSNKVIYACYKKDKIETEVNIKVLKEAIKIHADLSKHAVSQEFYNNASTSDKSKLVVENGLYTYYNESGDNHIYNYYRGAVNNNYVKLGKDQNNNDILWRIVWIRDDNRLKLVLDKTIPLTVKNKNNETVILNAEDKIMHFAKVINCENDAFNKCYKFYVLNPNCEIDYPKRQRIYNCEINSDNIISDFSFMFSDNQSQSQLVKAYDEILIYWYDNKFKLENKDNIIISDNNFCYDAMKKSGDLNEINYYNNNFECYDGDKDNPKMSSAYSSKVGLLNYAEIVRAGISMKNISNKSDNYLLSNSNNITLAQVYKTYSDGSYDCANAEGNSTYKLECRLKRILWYNVNNGILTTDTIKEEIYKETWNMRLNAKETGEYGEYINIANAWTRSRSGLDFRAENIVTYRIDTYNITTSDLKPVIVIDLSKVNLSDSAGTIDDPFTLINK